MPQSGKVEDHVHGRESGYEAAGFWKERAGHLASMIMRWGLTAGSLGALLCAGMLGLFLSTPVAVEAQNFTNPLHGSPEAIEKGYKLFHRYCSILPTALAARAPKVPTCRMKSGRGAARIPTFLQPSSPAGRAR